MTLHAPAHEEALRAARERGLASKAHAQCMRRSGLRRSRYVGLAKTHLQHILTAGAHNLVRLSAWLAASLVPARQSTFAQLMT